MWNHRTRGECQGSKLEQLRELLRQRSRVGIDLFKLCRAACLALDVLDQSGNDREPRLAFGTLELLDVMGWRIKVVVQRVEFVKSSMA